MRIPSADQQGQSSVFTAKNFAIIAMTLAFIYLTIVLVQVCTKRAGANRSERESELSEAFI